MAANAAASRRIRIQTGVISIGPILRCSTHRGVPGSDAFAVQRKPASATAIVDVTVRLAIWLIRGSLRRVLTHRIRRVGRERQRSYARRAANHHAGVAEKGMPPLISAHLGATLPCGSAAFAAKRRLRSTQ